ncbi:TPA: hypothetical protein DDY56_04135 [Candidatus Uhrbacteria bacterium]|nr:hypothetical protein [Candidatus Uhrbacteria bacterium]HAN06661.1 hypothetical protein [Candidatus Uhrbacteria bacterium]HBA52166.1 hypothetical protein [Candidatus Uhrbacteria bacterium]HBJ62773.1 hypothetical protein [Candidatus Uhrbacteria bacterium]HCH91407.1 hypothetical protein [Candidatus Uhrbacteria bacterium]
MTQGHLSFALSLQHAPEPVRKDTVLADTDNIEIVPTVVAPERKVATEHVGIDELAEQLFEIPFDRGDPAAALQAVVGVGIVPPEHELGTVRGSRNEATERGRMIRSRSTAQGFTFGITVNVTPEHEAALVQVGVEGADDQEPDRGRFLAEFATADSSAVTVARKSTNTELHRGWIVSDLSECPRFGTGTF